VAALRSAALLPLAERAATNATASVAASSAAAGGSVPALVALPAAQTRRALGAALYHRLGLVSAAGYLLPTALRLQQQQQADGAEPALGMEGEAEGMLSRVRGALLSQPLQLLPESVEDFVEAVARLAASPDLRLAVAAASRDKLLLSHRVDSAGEVSVGADGVLSMAMKPAAAFAEDEVAAEIYRFLLSAHK
jgi:hypothetical protein